MMHGENILLKLNYLNDFVQKMALVHTLYTTSMDTKNFALTSTFSSKFVADSKMPQINLLNELKTTEIDLLQSSFNCNYFKINSIQSNYFNSSSKLFQITDDHYFSQCI